MNVINLEASTIQLLLLPAKLPASTVVDDCGNTKGAPNKVEALRQTWDTPEMLYLVAGLQLYWYFLGRAIEGGWVGEGLGLSGLCVCSYNPN